MIECIAAGDMRDAINTLEGVAMMTPPGDSITASVVYRCAGRPQPAAIAALLRDASASQVAGVAALEVLRDEGVALMSVIPAVLDALLNLQPPLSPSSLCDVLALLGDIECGARAGAGAVAQTRVS